MGLGQPDRWWGSCGGGGEAAVRSAGAAVAPRALRHAAHLCLFVEQSREGCRKGRGCRSLFGCLNRGQQPLGHGVSPPSLSPHPLLFCSFPFLPSSSIFYFFHFPPVSCLFSSPSFLPPPCSPLSSISAFSFSCTPQPPDLDGKWEMSKVLSPSQSQGPRFPSPCVSNLVPASGWVEGWLRGRMSTLPSMKWMR